MIHCWHLWGKEGSGHILYTPLTAKIPFSLTPLVYVAHERVICLTHTENNAHLPAVLKKEKLPRNRRWRMTRRRSSEAVTVCSHCTMPVEALCSFSVVVANAWGRPGCWQWWTSSRSAVPWRSEPWPNDWSDYKRGSPQTRCSEWASSRSRSILIFPDIVAGKLAFTYIILAGAFIWSNLWWR